MIRSIQHRLFPSNSGTPIETPLKRRVLSMIGFACLASACGSSGNEGASMSGAIPASYQIVSEDGSTPSAAAGDALRLKIAAKMTDGTTVPLPSSATVSWSGPPVIKALPIGSSPDASILPTAGGGPAAMWLDNADHYSEAQLSGVLWILDPGTLPSPTLTVKASVTNASESTNVTATISVGATPTGQVARGQSLYAANCASCHGDTGQGSQQFPGLNKAQGNVAGDPSWNPALMAMSARADMDNMGVSLDLAMPKWLIRTSSTGNLLNTQDFADIYAWLATQSK